MTFLKLNKSFVSKIDRFLLELRQKLTQSDSQAEEVAQYKRISKLRDEKDAREERF